MSTKELFWNKVAIGGLDECWPWIAQIGSNGYGQFSTGRRHGLSQGAHRTAWALIYGPIPPGLDVLHRCDVKPCCNPLHLFLGTHQDNMSDMRFKGRAVGGRRKLTDQQVEAIRQDPRTLKELSLEYGVSRGQLSRIKRRQSRGK